MINMKIHVDFFRRIKDTLRPQISTPRKLWKILQTPKLFPRHLAPVLAERLLQLSHSRASDFILCIPPKGRTLRISRPGMGKARTPGEPNFPINHENFPVGPVAQGIRGDIGV